jgi:hypothetical protein
MLTLRNDIKLPGLIVNIDLYANLAIIVGSSPIGDRSIASSIASPTHARRAAFAAVDARALAPTEPASASRSDAVAGRHFPVRSGGRFGDTAWGLAE